MAALGGDMQCKLWPRDQSEVDFAKDEGLDLDQILGVKDLVDSDNTFFAATGVTRGQLLAGVKFQGNRVTTQSVVMRSRTGTVRFVDAIHRFDRLKDISTIDY